MAVEVEQGGQLQEFLGVLSRRRWQILLPTAAVLAIGICFATIVPKKFVVTTRVELKESVVGRGLYSSDPLQAATAREIGNVESHIKHFRRVREVILEQGELWDEFVTLSDLERYEFVKQVLKDLDVIVSEKVNDEGSTFLDIIYADVDGQRAERFLNRIRDVWIQDVVERDRQRVTKEHDVLQNQVEQAELRWKALNQEFFRIAKGMGIDPTQPVTASVQRDADPVYREQLQLETDLTKAEADFLTAQSAVSDLRERYDAEPDEIEEEIGVAGTDVESAIQAIELEIASLREKQVGMRPANSAYRVIERSIRKLEARIEVARGLAREDSVRTEWKPNAAKLALADQLEEAEAEERKLGQAFRTLEDQLDRKRRELSKRADDYRDYYTVSAFRADAETELSEARAALAEKNRLLALMADAYGHPFEIVEVPQADKAPTTPSGMVIVLFTLVGGLALGLVIALLAEYGGNSYRTATDISRVMAVPVLGVVGTILTRSQVRRERFRRSVVGVSSLILIGGLLWLTWMWYAQPDSLPTGMQQAIEDLRMKLR
jgi:capsular polysaccharide biosynthesis protein